MSSVSENRLYEHLKNELNKRKDLQQIKEILEKNDSTNNSNKINEFNIIYKFKLEKSKGDSLFSSINSTSGNIGSTLGVRTSSYLDQVNRYHMSKTLVSQATIYQRNFIRSFTDDVVKKIFRHKMNYFVKASLTGIFLFNLCKANENKNLYKLRKQTTSTTLDILPFYNEAFVSFIFAGLTLGFL